MNASAQNHFRPRRATEEFPLRLKRAGSRVTIYRHRHDKGYDVYTLVYYASGQRQRPTFASLEAAKDCDLQHRPAWLLTQPAEIRRLTFAFGKIVQAWL
jgi:hypothetical protein